MSIKYTIKQVATPLIITLVIVIINLLGNSCAKVGTPDGGPKDTIPPHIVKTKPINYTTEIAPRKITITFDEYIVLQNERDKFIVSPFIEEPVLPRVISKNVVIDLKDVEFDTTKTYTFDFGTSIADNNEKNPFPAYRFVFSPKDYIDSMSIGGTIVDAFTLLPRKEGFTIYLYQNLDDSVPKTTLPNYIAKADEKGNFLFTNVQNGEYLMFALVDGNLNNVYDLPTEPIAFLDTTVQIQSYTEYQKFQYYFDTIRIDSAKDGIIDTTIIDSLIFTDLQAELISYPDSLLTDSLQHMYDSLIPSLYFTDSQLVVINEYVASLYYFEADIPQQNLDDYSFEEKRYFNFEFTEPLADSLFAIKLLYPPYDGDWYLKETEKDRKIYKIWLPDTGLANSDSISILLNYPVLDSNNVFVTKYDTLNFFERTAKRPERKEKPGKEGKHEKQEEKQGRDHQPGKMAPPHPGDEPNAPNQDADNKQESNSRKGLFGNILNNDEIEDTAVKKDTVIIPKIKLNSTVKGKGHGITDPAAFICETPLDSIDTNAIQLFYMEDTIAVPTTFEFKRDSISLGKFYIEKDWEESATYKLLIPEGAVKDIYGAINDTILKPFTIQSEDHYGVLILHISDVSELTIIQLMDQKEKVLKEFFVENDTNIRIPYLEPATYLLKGIFDRNRNKKWDTGNYDEKRQPEVVVYYNGEATIRPNWDLELYWNLSDHIRELKEKEKKK